MTEKLMILGGSDYLLPVIETAHKLGIHVITCDELPDNIAHKYSDEYCNLNIVEKEAVLTAAQMRHINGIMSFACDQGVVSAAYTAQKMGLPFPCSYEAACILQDKGRFQEFLEQHSFHSPLTKQYEDGTWSLSEMNDFCWPVIVKPANALANEGGTKVDSVEDLKEAIETAKMFSRNSSFIIEEFMTFEGYHSSADVFVYDGRLRVATFSDQHFDADAANPYSTKYIVFPSTMRMEHQRYLAKEIQRLMKLLRVRSGIYHVESGVGKNGKPYILKVSPRGGEYRIAELQKLAYGVELIENEVRIAVGMSTAKMHTIKCDGYWCGVPVRARRGQSGILNKIWISPKVEEKLVVRTHYTAKKGHLIRPEEGMDAILGYVFLHFNSREELKRVMANPSGWIHIEMEKV